MEIIYTKPHRQILCQPEKSCALHLVREVGTSPESEKESSSENIVKLHEEARKPRRLKSIVKVSVAAAAIAVMVVAMGISAGAKREYRYVVREKDSVRNEIVLNNVEAIPGEDELDKAYTEIAKKTKIQAIRFAYIPEKMHYIKTDIASTRVVMYFEYDKYRVKIIQQFRDGGNSANIISDRKKAIFLYSESQCFSALVRSRQVVIESIDGLVQAVRFK